MNHLMLLAADAPTTVGDKLLYGGRMLLMGVGLVFGVLASLWLVLEIMQYFTYTLSGRHSAEPKASAEPPATKTPDAPSVSVTVGTEDEEEVVVAIAAAIAAAQSEQPHLKFRAVSFKRIH